ncbi:MAG: phage integrase N-terminal SAM-like domain-containing protein [Pyrinomonadaceae bacterium]
MYCTADPRHKYGCGGIIRAPLKPTPHCICHLSNMSSSRLLDKVRSVIRVKHFSLSTERAYVSWTRRFILFHHKRRPKEMAELEIRQFISHLAVDAKISASTQTVALRASFFLYRDVLKQALPYVDNIERAKPSKTLPVVFTRREVQAVLARLDGPYYVVGCLL